VNAQNDDASSIRRFPPGFLWGTATSAHQVEGWNSNNQWWAVEKVPGAIWHDDKSGAACNWWEAAEADFDRMQEMGLNTHRLSVEWSRIEPEPGRFDEAAIARYRAMLQGLIARGMRPMVCLHHFSNPLWLEAQGGWEHASVIERFQSFVRYTVTALRDLCDFWLTINEPQVYVNHAFLEGIFPPRKRDTLAALRVYRHMLLAHGVAYHTIHMLQPGAQVGNASALRAYRGERPESRLDAFAAAVHRYLGEEIWLRAIQSGFILPPMGHGDRHPALRDSFDFIGINYYTQSLIRFAPNPLRLFGERKHKTGAELSDSGRDGPYSWYAPDGLYDLCLEMGRLGKPIYVTENGLPDDDDDQRQRWLLGHLDAVQRAIRKGADVRGYYHWTFVDNFEWAEGWGLRFGLIALDPATQERTPRPSAALFAALAMENAITPGIVRAAAGGPLPTSKTRCRS
jgi:beta-glucosidase